MEIKIKLIHSEWEDTVILNIINNRLNRIKIKNECASFINDKNILYVKWDKWDPEVFITNNNENIYYLCNEINFIHDEWEDICYIDNFNKLIYRKENKNRGSFVYNNDEMTITWDSITENNLIENNLIEDISKNTEIDKIPNIIHFIYGFIEQKEEFELYKYIAIKSASDINKPDKIFFYYYYEPYGYWWDKIKPLLILEKIEKPTEIFGNKINHYAHQADIIRLEKLIKYGGIYLDIDTICLKSFKDLLKYDFVMGIQNNSDLTDEYGLCNAVILSAPNSIFANKWYESYKNFRSNGRDEYWDEHSVLKPLELSKIYFNDIKVLPYNSFFYPLWYNINTILFREDYNINEYKNIISNNYCIHLWDTYSNQHLKILDENIIFNKNTLYNILSRKFLRNSISILFLTYNRLEITQKCLNSYLKCLEREDILEIIIFDNNSDCETINYLKEFQEKNEKIKLIFSHENLGVCGGRSILFKEALGDIIISIDSDAYLISNDFFNKIKHLLYDEKYGIVGISGAYLNSWEFGTQIDINDDNPNEYIVDHISGCCQAFRKDLYNFGFGLDPFYGKFWVEDTDLSMQSLELNKINYRIAQDKYLEHHWGGSGKNFSDLFKVNWDYFVNKWKGKVLLNIN